MSSGGLLLLAAGASRRFGSDKRRHRLDDGTTLLEASVRCYSAVFDHVLVTLRPGDDLTDQVCGAAGSAKVEVVRCPDAHLGMGHSLACAARSIPDTWQYAFVALADMPWVQPETLIQLREAMIAAAPDAIVQPACGGRSGHPVGFGAGWFEALRGLTDDVGARPVLKRAGAHVQRIEVSDAGVLKDLDRPPD